MSKRGWLEGLIMRGIGMAGWGVMLNSVGRNLTIEERGESFNANLNHDDNHNDNHNDDDCSIN